MVFLQSGMVFLQMNFLPDTVGERRESIMKYNIQGDNLPVVICELDANESMITERGAMAWMSPNMRMETKTSGIGKGMGRMFSGDSFFQNIYTAQEKENIKVAFPMGLCMISEGVIPIAMNDIIRTVICTATGCGVTGAISFSLDVGSKVPSGGVFVIPAMSNPLAALIALLAGTAVTGVLLVLIKKKKTEEDEPMVDEKEEDLDLSGFTIS